MSLARSGRDAGAFCTQVSRIRFRGFSQKGTGISITPSPFKASDFGIHNTLLSLLLSGTLLLIEANFYGGILIFACRLVGTNLLRRVVCNRISKQERSFVPGHRTVEISDAGFWTRLDQEDS